MMTNKDWLSNRCIIHRIDYNRVSELLNDIDKQARDEMLAFVEELRSSRSKFDTRKQLKTL